MSNTKHTPTPWERNGPWIEKDGETIGQTFRMVGLNNEVPSANAAFIVRAVNSHEQLVAALRMAKQEIDYQRTHRHPDRIDRDRFDALAVDFEAALAAAEV